MPFEVNLWQRSTCEVELERLLKLPGSPARSSIARTFGVLDELVAYLRKSGGAAPFEVFRPEPLTWLARAASSADPWPDGPEGGSFAVNSVSIGVCLFQIGWLRRGIAVVHTRREIFVVWLSARFTDPPRDDGFVNDEDVALAQTNLWAELDLVFDLEWLESG